MSPSIGISGGSLWSNRSFLSLWLGQSISSLGSNITYLALPWLVLELTDSPAQMGIFAFVMLLPEALVNLPAGLWVDRHRRWNIMVLSDVFRSALLLSIPALYLAGQLQLWYLYAFAFLLSSASVIFENAQVAALPGIVDRSQLVHANARMQAANTAMRIVGPAAAGFLIALAGPALALAVDGITFIVSVISLLAVKVRETVDASSGSRPLADLWTGMKFLRAQRPLFWATAITLVLNLGYGPMEALFILHARNYLGFGEEQVGLIFSIASLGSMAAALMVERLSARGVSKGTMLVGSIFAGVVAYYGIVALRSFLPVSAAVALAWAAVTAFGVSFVSLRQSLVPGELLGRVNAAVRTINRLALPVAAAVSGAAAEVTGTVTVFAVGAAIITVAALASLRSPVIKAD